MGDKKNYITAKELSQRWGGSISTGTLNNWRALNQGPKFHKFGGRVLYAIEDVKAYEAQNKSKSGENDNLKQGDANVRN